jgi:hypothetical protein
MDMGIRETFNLRLTAVFGSDFVETASKEWGDPYLLNDQDVAISFGVDGISFRLVDKVSQVDPQYYFYGIDLFMEGEIKISEEIAIPHGHSPNQGDMVLLFHALVSEMVVAHRINLFDEQDKAFSEKIREDRNREINPAPQMATPPQRPTGEDHLLPGTSLYQNDWECQLVLAYAQAGFDPKEAIAKAKSIVYLQLHSKNAEPGSFSIFENRKPSIDQ